MRPRYADWRMPNSAGWLVSAAARCAPGSWWSGCGLASDGRSIRRSDRRCRLGAARPCFRSGQVRLLALNSPGPVCWLAATEAADAVPPRARSASGRYDGSLAMQTVPAAAQCARARRARSWHEARRAALRYEARHARRSSARAPRNAALPPCAVHAQRNVVPVLPCAERVPRNVALPYAERVRRCAGRPWRDGGPPRQVDRAAPGLRRSSRLRVTGALIARSNRDDATW